MISALCTRWCSLREGITAVCRLDCSSRKEWRTRICFSSAKPELRRRRQLQLSYNSKRKIRDKMFLLTGVPTKDLPRCNAERVDWEFQAWGANDFRCSYKDTAIKGCLSKTYKSYKNRKHKFRWGSAVVRSPMKSYRLYIFLLIFTSRTVDAWSAVKVPIIQCSVLFARQYNIGGFFFYPSWWKFREPRPVLKTEFLLNIERTTVKTKNENWNFSLFIAAEPARCEDSVFHKFVTILFIFSRTTA